jgi:DNA-binding NarL/FixJ family response regulator
MEISILIADQERTFVDALAAKLEDEDDINVVGAVPVKTPGPWLTAGRPVDIMVLDGDLPSEAANRVCAELSGRGEPTRVITLSSSSEPERIVRAVRAGTAAWVRKDQPVTYLLSVIRGVARGETWLPPEKTGDVMRLLIRQQVRQRKNERLLGALTPRERTVLACLAEGAEDRDAVARQLHLSVNTVRTHLQNLMAKLGVHSALEAVALTRDRTSWTPENGASSRLCRLCYTACWRPCSPHSYQARLRYVGDVPTSLAQLGSGRRQVLRETSRTA